MVNGNPGASPGVTLPASTRAWSMSTTPSTANAARADNNKSAPAGANRRAKLLFIGPPPKLTGTSPASQCHDRQTRCRKQHSPGLRNGRGGDRIDRSIDLHLVAAHVRDQMKVAQQKGGGARRRDRQCVTRKNCP